MKNIIGVLAGVLLVSTVSFGQQYQPLPFPQPANPALRNGTAAQTSTSAAGYAPSMAAKITVVNRHYQVDNGSPFPSAANPSKNW